MTEAFWSSREVLQHVLTLARARGAGPWAVLGSVLARAVATVPPQVALPPIVGGRMSLNFFVALTGPSGGGKGAADAAGLAGFTFGGPNVDMVPIGSGEGIARTFRPVGTKPDEPNPITSVVFSAPEVDSLAALASRQGATLSSELRKLYSGETLGFGNAGKDTRNIVASGSYRAALVLGVQPLRADVLLGASDGGLVQRFVWLPTSDPDAPDTEPADPGVWRVKTPAWSRPIGHLGLVGGDVDLQVPDVATDTIKAHRRAVLREDPSVDPLDGHANLTRLKLAAALMALDGRTIIDTTDWVLAGYVMDVSNYTRDRCRQALLQRTRSANTAKALATAERDEIVSDRKLQRAREGILRRIDGHTEQTKNELRMALKADIREYLEPALAELLDRGEIGISPAMRGTHKVHMYHRYMDQKQPVSSDNEVCTESTHVPTPLELAERRTPRSRQRTRGKSRTDQQTKENAS